MLNGIEEAGESTLSEIQYIKDYDDSPLYAYRSTSVIYVSVCELRN